MKIAFDNGVLDTRDPGVRSIVTEDGMITDDGLTEKANFDEELRKVEEAIRQMSLIHRNLSEGHC